MGSRAGRNPDLRSGKSLAGAIRMGGSRFARAQDQTAWISGFQSAMTSLATDLGTWAVLAAGISLVQGGKVNGVFLAALVLAALASFESVAPLPVAAHSLKAACRLLEGCSKWPTASLPSGILRRRSLLLGISAWKYET